jgi:DHA1 family multidrug resistance protein-like MFS transporter
MLPIMPLFMLMLLPTDTLANTYTGLVVGVSGAASTFTAVWLGRWGDKLGHRLILVGSSFMAFLFYLPQSLVQEAWQLLLLRLLTGAALGGIITSISALLATLTTPGEEGTVYGLDSSLNAASRTVAPLLGAMIALQFGLRAVFVFSGLLYLVITVVAMWRLPMSQAGGRAVEETAV